MINGIEIEYISFDPVEREKGIKNIINPLAGKKKGKRKHSKER